MKKRKIRGKVPSLIGLSNGRPERVDVKKKGICSRCKCDIHRGDDCLIVPKATSGYTAKKRYCRQCFEEIVSQTKKDLKSIETL